MALTIITPTSDRPEAFQLCQRWMARQTYAGEVQWIVADDGREAATCTMGQEHIRRPPAETPRESFLGNLLAALQRVRHDKVVFIEDDDWYAPEYLARMDRWLDQADLVGEAGARYYHLPTRRYHFCGNTHHASLAQTGLRAERLPKVADEICRSHTTFVDVRLWRRWSAGWKKRLMPQTTLSAGIKGLPGKRGIGIGHRLDDRHPVDADGSVLRQWIGADADIYFGLLQD